MSFIQPKLKDVCPQLGLHTPTEDQESTSHSPKDEKPQINNAIDQEEHSQESNEESLLQCPKCDKVNSNSGLMTDMKMHTSQVNQCAKCYKVFEENRNYVNHMRQHKRSKPKEIKCIFNCGLFFKSKRHYKHHKKKHMEEIREEDEKGDRTYLERKKYEWYTNALALVIRNVFHPTIEVNAVNEVAANESDKTKENNQSKTSDLEEEEMIININE